MLKSFGLLVEVHMDLLTYVVNNSDDDDEKVGNVKRALINRCSDVKG